MLTRNHVYILIQTFLHHHHKLYIYKNTTIYLINYNTTKILLLQIQAISIRNGNLAMLAMQAMYTVDSP